MKKTIIPILQLTTLLAGNLIAGTGTTTVPTAFSYRTVVPAASCSILGTYTTNSTSGLLTRGFLSSDQSVYVGNGTFLNYAGGTEIILGGGAVHSGYLATAQAVKFGSYNHPATQQSVLIKPYTQLSLHSYSTPMLASTASSQGYLKIGTLNNDQPIVCGNFFLPAENKQTVTFKGDTRFATTSLGTVCITAYGYLASAQNLNYNLQGAASYCTLQAGSLVNFFTNGSVSQGFLNTPQNLNYGPGRIVSCRAQLVTFSGGYVASATMNGSQVLLKQVPGGSQSVLKNDGAYVTFSNGYVSN